MVRKFSHLQDCEIPTSGWVSARNETSGDDGGNDGEESDKSGGGGEHGECIGFVRA